MLSIRPESRVRSDSAVRELFEPSGEIVKVCRSDDSIPRIADSERLLRVLIVDDNHDCTDSLSVLVSLWGNEVRTAYDGAAALAMTVGRQPDVVLLDLAMPKMDGCQVARQFRQQARFNHTLLIAISGYTDQAHRLLCDEAGFDHYLLKPIELADLENLLRRERCRLARMAEENERAEETRTALMKTEVQLCWS